MEKVLDSEFSVVRLHDVSGEFLFAMDSDHLDSVCFEYGLSHLFFAGFDYLFILLLINLPVEGLFVVMASLDFYV